MKLIALFLLAAVLGAGCLTGNDVQSSNPQASATTSTQAVSTYKPDKFFSVGDLDAAMLLDTEVPNGYTLSFQFKIDNSTVEYESDLASEAQLLGGEIQSFGKPLNYAIQLSAQVYGRRNDYFACTLERALQLNPGISKRVAGIGQDAVVISPVMVAGGPNATYIVSFYSNAVVWLQVSNDPEFENGEAIRLAHLVLNKIKAQCPDCVPFPTTCSSQTP